VELSEDATPQGLCAACLLKLGLSSTDIPKVEVETNPAKLNQLKQRHSWSVRIPAIVILLAIAAGFFFMIVRRVGPPPTAVLRFTLPLPEPGDFAVSPDGKRLAFTAMNPERKTLLWIRALDSFNEMPLTETEGAEAPFWSPDSQYVGFFARRKLRRVHVASGAAETLCDAPNGKGGSWSAEGVILFSRSGAGGLYRVSAHGGSPDAMTTLDPSRKDTVHRWPYFLPDNRHFLFTVVTHDAQHDGVFVGSLDSKEALRVIDVKSAAAYVDGSIVFARDGRLLAAPFDFKTGRTGDAQAIRFAEGVGRFSTSLNGVLVYRTDERKEAPPLGWLDRSAKFLGPIDGLTATGPFSLSPDGREIAASRSGDIWLAHIERGVVSRFTFDPAEDAFPIWSPDGRRIAFLSNRGGRRGIYSKAADAGRQEELLFAGPQFESLDSWSPDGRFISFTSRDDKGKLMVSTLPLDGDRKPTAIPSAFNLKEARFSPDSRWLAYVSDESGTDQVYVTSFPGQESKWQVSTDGGTDPKWRRDGRELYYTRENMLMAVTVQGFSPIQLSAPRPLFRMPTESYEVHFDGRFLMPMPREPTPSVPLNVVVNWTSEIH